jgi:hypothetical protein
MDEPTLRRLLLEMLCAPQPVGAERLRAVGPADWRGMARMAEQHRLGPILSVRYADEPAIPSDVAGQWKASKLYWACNAMVRREDLRATARRLTALDWPPLALKGAFLAWHAYPDPSLRPLRDIDLFVGAAHAGPAHAALRAAGYGVDPASHDVHARPSEPAATKHLEPLLGEHGSPIELHQRLWECDGLLDHHLPRFDEAALRLRAVEIDGILYPGVEDLFVHLVVHAVYSHRLDCGPLLLWDIRHLLPRLAGRWSALWERGREERWDRGGAVVIALARRAFGEGVVPRAVDEPPAPPSELVEAAIDLLLQDLDTRRSAGLAASALRGKRQLLRKRLAGSRWRDPHATATSGFVPWAASRLYLAATQLRRGSVRTQARGLSALSGWLDG